MKKNVLIFISLSLYLRNWLGTKAFKKIHQKYNVKYLVPKYDWDPNELKKYGIDNFIVIRQPEWRKFFFRKFLIFTMYKFSKKSKAFKIKLSYSRNSFFKFFYKLLTLFYKPILFLVKNFFPEWSQLHKVINDEKIDLILAPSIAADSFTIDLNLSSIRNDIKSVLIVNSWDNLVSKGVIPIHPDKLVVWGDQGLRQANEVQFIPKHKIDILGVPRFDKYKSTQNQQDLNFIKKFNSIPSSKKIILYASTSLPFNDHIVLDKLEKLIEKNKDYEDYVILYRPHPEMLPRENEKNILGLGYKHIYIDNELKNYYKSRFSEGTLDYLNNTDLEYYPKLLSSIEALVCPATTLSLEALLCGKPVLMICFNDGDNFFLSPDVMCQYENVEEILSNEFVISNYDFNNFDKRFNELLHLSMTNKYDEISNSLNKIIFRDDLSYSSRIYNTVKSLL